LIVVVKRDGSEQAFDINKVKQAILNAGGSEDAAAAVSEEVANWVVVTAVDNKIESLKIRDKVLAELKSADFVAAGSYEAYTAK
jgi:transcriptional regulator NrdR family protein